MTRKQIGTVCGAILLAVITPLLVLALLHAFDGTTQAAPSAQQDLQDPTFSISRASAQSPMPYDAADALTLSPGGAPPPVVARTCAQFGLGACGGGDDINSGSLGLDFILPPPDPANADAWLYFSVAPGSTGVGGTGVNDETVGAGCIPEPEADEFGSAAGGSNYQFLDGDGTASCTNPAAPSLGLVEPTGDDLDTVDPLNLTAAGLPMYGTADAGSPSLTVAPPPWNSPAAIYVDTGAGLTGYAAPGALGLAAPDDIDALCIKDVARDDYYNPAGGDIVWFSLTAASPSLAIQGDSPADVFVAPFTPGAPVVTAAQLGLNFDDELNALKCYQQPQGADIKVLTFYSDPPGPFTFDVSTYNVINLFEDKHNNGPLDALVDVWWSMDLIEDRDGDGIPDINVRWLAEPGDLCTYQGAYVPCGEGGVAGVPWDPASLPSPPPVDTDSCLDDIDNDGDGTCDVNGCTAYPNSPDPDCQVDIDDIEFQITLPVSVETPVERPLMLHCKPRSDTQPYTLTLYNEEWPVEMEDPNPDNNFQELAIDVICQVADPHYKIYDIYDPDAPAVDEYVTLEDQFHTQDNVLVGYPLTLLPPAIKYVDGLYAGGGTAAPHLKCYAIEGMPPADATVNLTTQFGTETDIYVDMAGWLCVPALKEVTYPEPVPPPPPPVPLEPHYVCYDIWPAATPPTGLNIELETQFGIESGMTWESGGALCAPVIKRDNATGEYLGGNLTAPHLRCYGMYMTDDPPHIVNLFTQFPDEYDVDVNFAYAMCVPAEKEIVADAEADKEVIDIEFKDPTGQPIDPAEIEILKSQDYTVSVTSVEFNNGPDQPVDAEISFYANIPAGCEGQWVPDTFDILTLDGDPSIPSSGTVTGPGMVAGLRTVDLHFQTLEYGIDEPPQSTLSFTRDFELHCSEADAFNYVFTFCNRADVKAPDVDPDLTNNLLCEDLFVTSLHNADIKSVSWSAPSPVGGTVGVPFEITVDEDKHNNGPQPADSDVTWTATAPAQVTAVWVDSGTSVLDFTVDLTSISVNLPVSRNLRITCNQVGGPYTITLDTAEQPVDPVTGAPWVDPVPGNNNDTTNVDVNCEAAGPAGVHYAAFSIFGGPPPPVPPVDIETQFGEELGVDVGPAVTLMAPALKNGEGTLDATHLKCYDIASSEDPFHLVDLTTQFGLEEDVEVGPARELCMPAAKEVVFPTYVPPGPLEPAPHYKCYEITGAPLGMFVELVTQFFSPEPVVILDVPTRLCAPALKNGEPGNLDDYPHLKCYDIPFSPPIGYLVNLETQFGFEFDVEVGPALRLCMPAVKDLVCQPTALVPVDTDGDTFTDDIETYLPTDCLDDCTDNPGVHDAWPLDIDMNTAVNLTGDAIKYVGKIGCVVATNPECKRLDLDMNGVINLTGDAIKFVGHIGDTCT